VRGDKSGLLGAGIRQYGGPRYCLNGQKYFLSGWMSNTTETVDLADGAFKGAIVAFVDRDRANVAGTTLIRIPFSTGADVFLIYNRQKSFNDGVRAGANFVTISQTVVSDPIESNRLAMLDSDQSYTILGTTVVIHVCSKSTVFSVDMVTVSIFDTSLGQHSTCALNYPLTMVSESS
jgi:hypothetical protein